MGHVFKKGQHWYITYYVKGARKRKKIGPSKEMAALALKDQETVSLLDALMAPAESRAEQGGPG